ncbi:multicopper oxidase family protein [Prosthecobacter sp.]|uniref:multicopper oxidase family protein n=1 Tax=Prosthecobacter sp. TaxID=1965333 RepID=UPI003783B5CE
MAQTATHARDASADSRPSPGQRVVEYDLHISEQRLAPAGRKVRALTINGTIPGPVLRFREGDFARIRVHNDLRDEETSTHWHGLLLPNKEDGVPYVTTPPILPGQTHTFQFTLRQSGTYWFHSHTHLQEQSGVYGGIVVEPRGGEPVKADREQVLILSDWTNIEPYEVMRMLMRGSDYFGIMRHNSQSILGAWKRGNLKDYFRREWSRMVPMDVSDVGYDAFLINGQRQTRIGGRPGERVRLRVINASAASYFHLTSSAGPMTIVAADGPPVQPVQVDRFLMAIAETYDLIVTIPASGEYELRATAQDGSGHASALMGQGAPHPATSPPRPNLYQMDQMLSLSLEEQESDPRAPLKLARPGSPYKLLKATHDTTLPAKLPHRKITLHLTGDMVRYVWSFDGKTIAEAPYVKIRKGEVIELELVNDTMMHHPIHLHGHFFRLLVGNGARSPLKHTVDVPPMSKRTLEFEANEDKDWMFHCHILYHMMSGMARVFRYEDDQPTHATAAESLGHAAGLTPDMKAATPGMASHHHSSGLGEHSHDMSYFWGAASLQTQMSNGLLSWMNPKNNLLLSWELGWRRTPTTEHEVDAIYQRYFNMNFQAYAGFRFANHGGGNRAIAGFNYRLPLMFLADVTVDSNGNGRFQISKRFQLTPRLGTSGYAFYDTGSRWEWSAGADYTLKRNISLSASYHSDYGPGLGLIIRF